MIPDVTDYTATLGATGHRSPVARRTIRILDGCCGAGGAARGYYEAFTEAGYDVDITGVDVKPQKHYPYRFWQGDVIEHLMRYGQQYDFIGISPPCQAFTMSGRNMRTRGMVYETGHILPAVLRILDTMPMPWIVENVPFAPMQKPVKLCGSMFGLNVVRHRLFDSNFLLYPPGGCRHTGLEICCVGSGTPSWVRQKLGRNTPVSEWRAAMGIDWMTQDEMSQAIPPAYTHWLGMQIARVLEVQP